MNYLSSILARSGVSEKISTNVMWNIASYGIIAVIGLLLNFVIAFYYDTAVLGVFNQVFAYYIFLSQLAVGGVHLSMLKAVAQSHNDEDRVIKLFTSGMILTLLTSLFVSLITYLLKEFLGEILRSQDVSVGVGYIVPGLLFFSLNKTMLALINGLNQMKDYAIFQALRYIFFLLSISCLVALSFPGNVLPVIFSLSEGALFLLLLIKTYKHLDINGSWLYKDLYYSHALFGLKAAGGNLLLDINTRVDVIVLGYFASDRIVGIYSIAALVVEGFCQLPVVLRANVNPLITQGFYNKNRQDFQKLLIKIRNLSFLVLSPVGIIIALAFPLLFLIWSDPDLIASWKPLVIIMVGVLMSVGYLPLLTIFNQTGHPASQTILIFVIFLTNLILNILLVPLYGLIGSAIATGLTFALQGLYIRWLVFRIIKSKI
ncbi:MAG: oligosaccharide flippase family protein [Anaerolineales bacterium]|nr:oligosaccharide flippase family protein [Anaerolineales bacterium]